jgi:hypothetical protein
MQYPGLKFDKQSDAKQKSTCEYNLHVLFIRLQIHIYVSTLTHFCQKFCLSYRQQEIQNAMYG